jgi:site-specific recombinase XerD
MTNSDSTKKDLQELYDDFMDECRFSACLRPETIRGYRAVFDLFIKVMPEVVKLEDLTNSSLNEFFKRIYNRQRIVGRDTLKTGVKNSTVKTHWTKLNVFFKWLKNNKHIKENPLETIRPPKVRYDDYKRLTDGEVRRILSSIVQSVNDSFTYYRDIFMVNLFLQTGIRRTEFISIRLTDLDLFKRTITIRGETSKSKFTRTLKINSILFMHLSNYLAERRKLNYKTDNLVVSTREDRGLTIDGLKHWTERLKEMSKVKFHVHQFRHTFACKLIEANVSIYKVKELLGHTDIKMTVKYLRSLNTEDMGEDIEKISFS